MERFQNFCILFCLILTLSAKVSAQSSASATISATIVTPIDIQKVPGKDLNFGVIAAGKSAGIVTLSATGMRTTSGSVTLPSASASISPAEFVVTGEGLSSFSISLPASPITMINPSNSETMQVEGFTSSPESTGTLASGRQTVKIGATLKINANQAPGQYSSAAPFYVTVNYN